MRLSRTADYQTYLIVHVYVYTFYDNAHVCVHFATLHIYVHHTHTYTRTHTHSIPNIFHAFRKSHMYPCKSFVKKNIYSYICEEHIYMKNTHVFLKKFCQEVHIHIYMWRTYIHEEHTCVLEENIYVHIYMKNTHVFLKNMYFWRTYICQIFFAFRKRYFWFLKKPYMF